MLTKTNRRQWERRSLSTTVLFRKVDGPNGPFHSGTMRDVSDGGVSFDTDTPPADGDLLDLFFKAQSSAADQRVRGRVAWVRQAPTGGSSVGVGFVT